MHVACTSRTWTQTTKRALSGLRSPIEPVGHRDLANRLHCLLGTTLPSHLHPLIAPKTLRSRSATSTTGPPPSTRLKPSPASVLSCIPPSTRSFIKAPKVSCHHLVVVDRADPANILIWTWDDCTSLSWINAILFIRVSMNFVV